MDANVALPPSKLSLLKAAWARGDRTGAIRIAAKFQDLGEHKEAITRAWQAIQDPDFYRAIGKDPDALIAAGYAALKERYGL